MLPYNFVIKEKIGARIVIKYTKGCLRATCVQYPCLMARGALLSNNGLCDIGELYVLWCFICYIVCIGMVWLGLQQCMNIPKGTGISEVAAL